MRLNAKFAYNGQCAEAFRLYAECLGGELVYLLTWGDSPVGAGYPEMKDKVMHATLKVGEQVLTGADVVGAEYRAPVGCSIQMNLTDQAQAQRIYAVLAQGATVQVPLGKTFWAELYAVLTDRFGTPWEINCS